MMDFKQFNLALNQIAEEKGIAKERILETIEQALAAAYKKDYGKKGQIIRAKFNPETGDVSFEQIKLVVDEAMLKPEPKEGEEEEPIREPEDSFGPEGEEIKKVRFNAERHIMLDEAKKIKKDTALGEELIFLLETKGDYGRIAAQTAKQVITQRIREAERDVVFEEYKSKQGEVISGIVQRVEGGRIFVDLGRTVALMHPEEKIPGEHYRIGSRIRAFVLSVERLPKGPSILLSRSHPRFVSKLFEMEVPEIAASTVEIKSIAREAGSRTKVAVASNEKGVDPIGSLVGQKGTRVSTVINELAGEKIDIVEWSDDMTKFIANALSPAKIVDVVVNDKKREAKVLVAEDQLSLAIGKGGQNVRLAAKLSGWKIDVRNAETPNKPVEGGISSETEGEEIQIEASDKEVLPEAPDQPADEDKTPTKEVSNDTEIESEEKTKTAAEKENVKKSTKEVKEEKEAKKNKKETKKKTTKKAPKAKQDKKEDS
jgi:N utilization substance protein A